ncbi:SDR family NAD(P)-dependent oxidoreductase [Streptomyces mobaraensis]|uniref:SDR family NAD(P)-dependent oxidoreductase n=1 Tax=Streptomyces mobaraensis TaxID=35621 RepID=UPI0033FE682A
MSPADTSQPSTAPTTPEDPDTLLFPASYAQQRMWFFHHLDRGNPYYNIPLALRLTGEADPAALQAALDGVVARHEILRTTFTERDGEPHQLVAPTGAVRLETAECAAEDEHPWALEWVGRPFDLTTGPLFRAALLTTAPGRHLLLLCLHHIVTDGWSLNILTRELAALYRQHRTGEPAGLEPLEIQYADFAEWQREQLDGAGLDRRLDYWRGRLAGDLPPLDVPTDHPRPPVQSFRGARVDFELPDDLTRALRATGRAHGTTLFMTLLAGVTALLHRWTGQDDILVGSPIAGRDVPETEPLLGLFVNTLVLRGDVSGAPTFADLLARTRRACTGAYDHQDVPLDKLVEVLQPERDPGRNPLFQVMFALQNPPRLDFPLPGAHLAAEPLPRHSTRFDLEFHLWEDGDRLHGSLVYGTDLFDGETAERTASRLRRLLAAAVRAPETPVADLPFADEEPAARACVPADPDTTVPAAFAERLRREPDAVAFAGGGPGAGETGTDGPVTVARLSERAQAVAGRLAARGVARGTRVGLHLPPGPDAAAAALALLALGAVCVPVEPDLPVPAARAWLAAAGADTVLTDRPAALPASVAALDLAVLDGEPLAPSGTPQGPVEGPRGADPAFVLRGAAGPVAYGHAALCATLDRLQELGRLGAGDTVLHHRTAPLPDAVHALLWPLLHGAAVRPAPGAGPLRCTDGGVTVALLPPAGLDELARARGSFGPRLVLTDGGRLTARLADRFLAAHPETVLHRIWTLPEAAGCVAALHCRPGLTDAQLAAGAGDQRHVTVVDGRGRALPSGVPGLLSVHRPGAAAPEPTPWRGRRLHDGRLAVADDAPPRLDGYAADLPAIENALLTDDTLAACAVLPRTTADGVEELVAYAVPTGPFSARRSRERAAALLPAALVPRTVVPVTALPRDRSGRLDTAALAALPVVDEDAARAWERELTAAPGGPAAAVLVEEAAPEPEERVHVPLPVAARDRREPGPDEDAPRPSSVPEHGGRPAVAAGPPAVAPSVRTLPEALRRAADEGRGGIVIVDRHGDEHDLPYGELTEDAARVLGGLRALGLRPGDRAVLQCPGHRDFLTAFWACLLGGFVPVPLAPSDGYGEDTATVERLAGAWELLGRPLVLADAATAAGLRGLATRRGWGPALRVGVLDELRGHAPDPDEHPCAPDDVALLLLTSGSTGTPKAVPLRHRNILARCAGTSAANGFGAEDVTFNWMPLDHVGGIVMFHVRDVYLTARQIHAPTGWVLEDPLRWLDAVHRHRVTLTWAPNFAFGLVNDRVAGAAGRGWDLSCLRFIQNAGESIMPRVARRFLQALAPLGLPATAMRPSWGMSETSSAVTYSAAFTLATTSDTDPFTEVGRPLPGTTLRIVDDAGETVPEGVPGRLQVSGPTVTSSYHDNEEENRASFTPDGWFETGDLGVVRDGAVTITGRAKDVLIINGVNHYCHEIESVVEESERVENSFTAACAVRDAGATTDGLAVFFHPAPGADVAATIREIRTLLVRRTGLNPRHVVPVRREDVPKTEIGKIQRAALRRRFHSGGFDAALAEVDLLLGNERTTLPNWFHERVWRPSRPLPGPAPDPDGTLLVLADPLDLADHLLPELAARGRRVVRVDAGTEYARVGDDRFRIRLDRAEDHGRALDALAADGRTVTDVLDLTTYAPPAPSDGGAVGAETAALVHLVQALAARRADGARVTLRVVGRHTQHAAPGDVVDCGRAARLGLLTSLGQELPWLDCAHLDLQEAPVTSQLPFVLAELVSRREGTEAAVRNGARTVPRLATLRPPSGTPTEAPFPRGGLVVVTGGLGGLGTEICAHLMDAYDARLLVLGRTELPPEDTADAPATADTTAGRRLAAYRALRARGEHVLYATADITRADEIRTALDKASDRWSLAPAAVLHLAGTFRQRPFLEQSVEELADVMAPKTLGTRALLDALGDAADGIPFVTFSSVNGTFGGAMVSAYAAANAHLDALARAGREEGRRFSSIAWSLWDETGMSAGRNLAEPGRARGYRPIGRAEGVRSFVHALRLDRPHVLVGLDPSRPWIRAALDAPARPATALTAYTEPRPAASRPPKDGYGTPLPVREVTLDALPRTPDGSVDRAALRADRPGPGAAPAGKTQRLVARVWCEVLGVDRVGPDENFFDLGGHSLLMARVHGSLQTALDREFSMVDLFRHPTVATLAAFLDTPTTTPPDTPAPTPATDRAARRRAARGTGRRRR